ncbi:MAG: lysine--tRNA ligase, partial [Anaerolineae bacterium]
MPALTDQERQRLAKLERIRQQGVNPYPHRVERTHTAVEAVAAFEAAEARGQEADRVVVVGRLRSMRVMGKSSFAHIEDGTGRIQLFLRRDQVGEEIYDFFCKDFDLGDFLEAKGHLFRTRTGEVTVLVSGLRMLAKAISPPPVVKEQVVGGELVRYSAFSDVEERFRQRYADLASNPEVRQIFWTRARATAALRQFLDGRGFIEVETPILQPVYGGAAARPFITYHHQLHQELYLRISFELYLKRLLVGMYEKVYEIGRDFRNEGVSFKHNTEFTMLEFYWAYADYNDVMDLTEQMVSFVAQQVLGSTTVAYQGHQIDLSPPWRRATLREVIREATGIDYEQYPDAESLAAAMREIGHEPDPESTWGKLVDSLLSTHVEPNVVQPTFVLDYPRQISPLAKKKPEDPSHVERFEGFVVGMELCNAFTELNDPLDQEERFMEMGRLYHALGEYAKAADCFARVREALEDPQKYGLDEAGRDRLLGEPGPTYLQMGECFLESKRLDEAVAAFEKAHQLESDEALLSYQLARVDAQAGKPAEALAKLQASFDKRLARPGIEPYRLLARLLKELGKEDELVSRLEKLHAGDPENAAL